jgi:cell wall-associated NlpC family hydrolase
VSTAAAAAAFVLVAVLPGTPSALGQGRAPAPANDLPTPAALGQLELGPGPFDVGPRTAGPPVPSLGAAPGAMSTGSWSSSPALDLTGGAAAPTALRAVRFALSQVGKPYVWGAEGPDTYDCSGLVQAAYASAGVGVPRVARAQYRATTPVPVAAMLPGDLLFFGPDPADVESIHHVGIYLGGGRMVHAPTAGDVVRVAPVWWAEFFGAARVVGAVPGRGDAVPFTVPAPVIRTVSRTTPDPRPPAGRPASPAARDRSPSGGEAVAAPPATPPAASPTARDRRQCPATDRPAPGWAGSAGSVTGLVDGLLGGVLGAAPRTAAPRSPACAPPPAARRDRR